MQDVEMRRMYTKRMANKTMLSSSEAMEKLRKIHEDFKPTNVNWRDNLRKQISIWKN